jgi:hypothetical protein
MGYVVQKAIDTMVSLLEGPGGIQVQLAQMAETQPEVADAIADFVIRGFGLKRGVQPDEEFTCIPRIRVQAEKLANQRRLKYLPFSGTCWLQISVDASDDRQELVAAQLNAICDAILLVLDNHVGELCGGVYYGGGYELTVQPMDKGSKGYQQTGLVRLELAMEEGGHEGS